MVTPGSQETLVRRAGGHVDRLDPLIVQTFHVVHLAGLDLAVVDRVAVLALIELLPHHVVQVTAAEVEDLAERFSEVSVQRRVDNWVQQAVAVTEPEEQAREERGDGVRILEERPDKGEHEERQPADDERAHYDAQGGAGFPLFRQVEPQFLLVGRVRHAAGAVQVVSHDRRLGRRHRRRGRRGRCEDGLLELLQHRALGLVALAGSAGETSYRVTAALQHQS